MGFPTGASGVKRSLPALIAHTFGTIIFGTAAQVAAGIFTARAFGPVGKGIISYAGVFIVFGVASAEGLRSAIAFQFGNQRRPLGLVWSTALRSFAIVASAGFLIFLALWLRDPSQIAFLFVALAFPFAAFMQTVNIVYLVRHAIERINVQNALTVSAGGSLATIFAVLVFHANVAAVLSIWVGSYVAAALWAASGVPSLLRPRPDDPVSVPAVSLWSEQARFALKVSLSAIVTLMALRIDIIIVGAVLPKASLGLYTTALAVAELMSTISRAVTYASTGRISTEEHAAAIALTSKVIRLLLVGQCLIGIVVFLAGPYAIDLLYGARFVGAGLLLRIVLARTIVYSVDGVVSYFITVRAGRPGMQFAFELGTLALCATATSLAVRPYGLVGAACAATATFLLAFIVKLAYYMHVTHSGPGEVLRPRASDLPETVRVRIARGLSDLASARH